MSVRRVQECGWAEEGDSMGTLVDEGILARSYDYEPEVGKRIYWTNISTDVIVIAGKTVILQGETIVWEG
jgi:hypothetical protein|tara:strand:- start:2008 stop:2217 length:210 start_codon:yes stop_codon:yes gene_type:complete